MKVFGGVGAGGCRVLWYEYMLNHDDCFDSSQLFFFIYTRHKAMRKWNWPLPNKPVSTLPILICAIECAELKIGNR